MAITHSVTATGGDSGALIGQTAWNNDHIFAGNYGVATIDFGAYPGANEASLAITGLTAIVATSKVELFIMGDDTTTDHTDKDHRFANALMGLTAGTPTAGTGFTIYATSTQKIQGTFKVRWLWSD